MLLVADEGDKNLVVHHGDDDVLAACGGEEVESLREFFEDHVSALDGDVDDVGKEILIRITVLKLPQIQKALPMQHLLTILPNHQLIHL